MVEGIDREIFLGDNGATPNAADIVGLTTAAGLVEKSVSQAGKVKGADTLQVFAELIDGKAAMMPSDLKAVFAVGANTLWSHQLANTGASVDTTIAEFLAALWAQLDDARRYRGHDGRYGIRRLRRARARAGRFRRRGGLGSGRTDPRSI